MPDTLAVNEPVSGAGDGAVALDRLPVGATAKVVDLEVDSADSRRLKALGLCAGRTVEVIATGDPLIVRVVGARVGLSGPLARHVLVTNR